MSRLRPSRSNVLLPWERRYAWLRHLLLGSQWSLVLGPLFVLWFGIQSWQHAEYKTRVRVTRVAIEEAQEAVAAFRRDHGRCPRSTVELTHPPRSSVRYLAALPRDGWDRPLRIRCPDPEFGEYAEVISAGPSGSFFEDDNIQ